MRVLVTDPIDEIGIDRLREAGFTVDLAFDLDDGALEPALSGADALVVRSATTVSGEVLDAVDELRIIARAGIGVDNIDVEAATRNGVQVVNAPTGGVDAVAEHTIALAYALVREIPRLDRQTRDGDWPKGSYAGNELVEQTLGIIGIGRIGSAVAETASALGLDIVGYDPHIVEDDLDIELVDFDTCLRRADIVTVHAPLTEATAGMIDASALATLGDGYVINCARGGIIDETALVEALETGSLRGAALDVFEDEPISSDDPLCGNDRTILTPHVAGSSDRAQRTIAREVADQVIDALEGRPVEHPVNDPA
ncbi:MAG: hydroxyacid dehydrogenase [Halobacteriota archaeon]